MRLIERCPVAKSLWIEHHHIGKIPWLQVAALRRLEYVGRQTAGAANGMFRGNHALLNGEPADLARKAPIASRVGHGISRRLRRSIPGRGHERLLHNESNILLIHAEVDDLCA